MKLPENENLRYKIGGDKLGFIFSFIMFAVFGGLSYWLYISGNGAFIFTGLLTALVVLIILLQIYRFFFVKTLIGERGIYNQTNPMNGKYYTFSEITEAWASDGKSQSGQSQTACCFRSGGDVVRFWYTPADEEGVDYFLTCVNGEGLQKEEEYPDEY